MSPTNVPLSSNALALQDSILLRDISINATVGPDRWGKVRAQPVLISVRLSLSLVEAATNDDLDKTINYGLLTKDILKVSGKEFRSVFELARAVLALIRETVSDGRLVSAFVNVEALNQFLTAHSFVSTITYDAAKDSSTETITIKDLQLYTIIGVNPPERIHKQSVVTNVVFHGVHWEDPSWPPRAVAAITEVMTFAALMRRMLLMLAVGRRSVIIPYDRIIRTEDCLGRLLPRKR
jgi:FolB domain-containing protein